MRTQAVVQASSRPPTFLPTVADEDLPVHFCSKIVSSIVTGIGAELILAPEFSSGEPQYLTLTDVILPERR